MRSRSALRLAYVLPALAAAALVAPASVNAAPTNCQAPPGTSGIDQYCESIPAAGGDQGTRGGGGGGSGHHVASDVSRRTASALSQSAAGRAILGLTTGAITSGGRSATAGGASDSIPGAGGTAKKGAAGKNGQGNGSQGSGSSTPSGKSDNPLEAVRSAVTTGTSAGPGFIWILLAVAVLMAALGWLRYRRSHGSPS